jgi:hypothetical protein
VCASSVAPLACVMGACPCVEDGVMTTGFISGSELSLISRDTRFDAFGVGSGFGSGSASVLGCDRD